MSKDDTIINVTGFDDEDYDDHTILGGQSGYSFDDDNTITIDTGLLSSYAYGSGSISVSSTGHNYGQILTSNGTTSASWVNSNQYSTGAGLHVENDAHFEGDIKWKGRSLGTLLETIESRLAILVPDPEKLEHFEALKKAYDHYKLLEALCELPKETKE